ncbi:hypothetical protein Nepgr_030779 [Nepenthes gracilis]|uniref:GST C-terminal domain-containing protein n=1 Tax=Nepenthes gracilis TaxID=150966 RepID=A0AAD3Y6X0_NEPGR|nr:hypothetical protein Nepgr_030779 [Nepenthes gracilis]
MIFLQVVASKKNQTQLRAHPSTLEHILSFKPAKDSGGADLAELGKTHVAILRYCRDASVLPSCCYSAEMLLFYRDDTILFRIKLFTGSFARRDMYMEEITLMRQAPAIAHGEFKLFESHAILIYLACAFPTVAGHWYPTDLFKRAKIHSVLDWPHTNLRRGSVEYLLNAPLALFFGLPLNPQAAAEGEKVLIASMSKIESFWLHEDGKFLLGNDQPSIADLSPLSEVMQLEVMLDQIGSYELNHILAHSQRLNSNAIASFVKDSLAFETMEKIVREYFPFTTETKPMNFTGCVRCLITFTSSRFNSDVSLNAIVFLKFCASKLAEVGLVCNEDREDACSYILAGTEGGFDGHDFTTKELGALNKGVRRHKRWGTQVHKLGVLGVHWRVPRERRAIGLLMNGRKRKRLVIRKWRKGLVNMKMEEEACDGERACDMDKGEEACDTSAALVWKNHRRLCGFGFGFGAIIGDGGGSGFFRVGTGGWW